MNPARIIAMESVNKDVYNAAFTASNTIVFLTCLKGTKQEKPLNSISLSFLKKVLNIIEKEKAERERVKSVIFELITTSSLSKTEIESIVKKVIGRQK